MHSISSKELSGLGGMWARVIASFFRLLYHEMAWSYDLVASLVSFGLWRKWGETALDYVCGEQILELGPGPGHLLLALHQKGYRVFGLEPSAQMIGLAHRRITKGTAAPNLAQGHSQYIPFATNSFDSVVASFPTEYLTRPETLGEVTRVLRPKGRLVVVLGARLCGRDPLTRYIEWLYSVTGQRHQADTTDIRMQLSKAGLTVTDGFVEIGASMVWLLVAQATTLRGTDRRESGSE